MLLSNVWYCILNKIQWRKCLQVANREDGLRLRCSLQTKKVHCLLSRKVTFNPSRFLLVRTVKMCDQKNLPWPDQSLDLNIVSFLQIWREEYKADYLLQHPWSNWQMFWCSDIRLIKSMNLYQRPPGWKLYSREMLVKHLNKEIFSRDHMILFSP